MHHVAGDGSYNRKGHVQRLDDAAQKSAQIRAQVLFRRVQLKGEDSSRRELFRCLAEKVHGIKAVQLRSLRRGQVDDDDVKNLVGRPQEQSSICVVHMHAGVGAGGSPLFGEIFVRQFEHSWIELDVIPPLKTRMLKSLQQASASAASDEKKGSRSGVLEQSKMHGLFGGGGIRCVEHHQAVLKQAANSTGF